MEGWFLGPSVPLWLPSVVQLNQTVGAMPLLEGNTVDLVTDFPDQLAALVAAVDGASRYVHVEFYILSYDVSTAPFFVALGRAVARGGSVRVLLDHLGSRPYAGYRITRRELTRMGAEWHLMLPVQPWRGRYQRPDLPNHRKLLVVDGVAGFVGSKLDRPELLQAGDPSPPPGLEVKPAWPGGNVEHRLLPRPERRHDVH